MKQSTLIRKLLPATLLFLFCSCGGDDKKDSTETTETTTSDTTTTTQEVSPPVPASTISTNRENMMIVRHRTGGYAKWKPSYDKHDSMRLANGLHNYVLGRSLDDSNMVLVALKADDMAKAKTFSKDPRLRQAMQQSGVTGTPTIQFFTTIWQDTAKLSSNIRAMNIMTVKDRDAWQKAFDEGKQERTENGIEARVIAYDADNDKKILLVNAVMDTAKANAYWKSDALKKRRDAGGVIGTPERFVFEVLKRY